MPSEQSDINVVIPQQDEVQDILGNPPSWLLRWGISVVAFAMLIFLSLSYIIKYPDMVEASVVVTSHKPPIPVIAKKSGRIVQIDRKANSSVSVGDVVARMESVLVYEDLFEIDTLLWTIDEIVDPLDYLDISIDESLRLGALQPEYSSLIQEVEDVQHYLREGSIFVKIRALHGEIKQVKRLNQSIEEQEALLDQELSIQGDNVSRHQFLRDSGVVSAMEFEAIQASYLLKQQQLKSFQTNRIRNDVQIEQLRTQISDLMGDRRTGLSDRLLRVKRRIRSLKGDIDRWRDEHLLTAPIAGDLAYTSIWSEDQFVEVGQPIFTVLPSDIHDGLLARCFLPIQNSGKVKIGNRVNILLDAYPHHEYGILTGEVGTIALLPTPISEDQKGYVINVSLPDTLTTTYHRHIPFKQEMQGTAQIITEERRIIDRIFDKLLSILNN